MVSAIFYIFRFFSVVNHCLFSLFFTKEICLGLFTYVYAFKSFRLRRKPATLFTQQPRYITFLTKEKPFIVNFEKSLVPGQGLVYINSFV